MPAIAAGLIGGAALLGSGAYMVSKAGPSKSEIKKQREFLNYSRALALEEPKAAQARTTAGFESNLATLGMFGQPGTYGPNTGAPVGVFSGQPLSGGGSRYFLEPTVKSRMGGALKKILGKDYQPGDELTEEQVQLLEGAKGGKYGVGHGIVEVKDDPYSIFDQEALKDPAAGSQLYREKYGKEYFEDFRKPREGVIDPKKFAGQVSKMPTARIISGQVAEAYGLTDPHSPFRQTLEASIKNPIIEAGAQSLRESMRYIQNQAAKGGSARRTALQEAQTMLAIERSNRIVAQEMWNANLAFETWIRDYQRTAVNAAFDFTRGLGVNEYVNAMNSHGQFLVSTAVPTAVEYSQQAFELATDKKKAALGKFMMGAGATIMGAGVGGLGGASGAVLGAQIGAAVGGIDMGNIEINPNKLLGRGGSQPPQPGTPGSGGGTTVFPGVSSLPEGGAVATGTPMFGWGR